MTIAAILIPYQPYWKFVKEFGKVESRRNLYKLEYKFGLKILTGRVTLFRSYFQELP